MKNTNFFTELEKFKIDAYSLSIVFKNGICTISLLPRGNANDKAINLKPLILSAKTEEMDLNFFNTISKNLENTSTFFSNTESYEKKLKIQQEETAEKKELKTKIKKLEDKLSEIFENESFNPKEEESKILKLCKDILTLDSNNKNAKRNIEKINNLTNTLF